jgi:hypothetical protein
VQALGPTIPEAQTTNKQLVETGMPSEVANRVQFLAPEVEATTKETVNYEPSITGLSVKKTVRTPSTITVSEEARPPDETQRRAANLKNFLDLSNRSIAAFVTAPHNQIVGGLSRALSGLQDLTQFPYSEIGIRGAADAILGGIQAGLTLVPGVAPASMVGGATMPFAGQIGEKLGGETGKKVAEETVGVLSALPFGVNVALAAAASAGGQHGVEQLLNSTDWGKSLSEEDRNRILEASGHTGFLLGLSAPVLLRKSLTQKLETQFSPEQVRDIYSRVDKNQGTPEENNFVRVINTVFQRPGEAVRRGVKLTSKDYYPGTPEWLKDIIGEVPEAGTKFLQLGKNGERVKLEESLPYPIRGKIGKEEPPSPTKAATETVVEPAKVVATAEVKTPPSIVPGLTRQERKALIDELGGPNTQTMHGLARNLSDADLMREIEQRRGRQIEALQQEPSEPSRPVLTPEVPPTSFEIPSIDVNDTRTVGQTIEDFNPQIERLRQYKNVVEEKIRELEQGPQSAETEKEIANLKSNQNAAETAFQKASIEKALSERKAFIEEAKKRGVKFTDEAHAANFVDDVSLALSQERPYIEQNFNRPVKDVFDEIVNDYLEQQKTAEGKEPPPSEKPRPSTSAGETVVKSTPARKKVIYQRGSVGDAVAAAKRLKADHDLYVFPTTQGMAIAPEKPPFGIQHIIVKPDGTHQVVSASESFEAGRRVGVEPLAPAKVAQSTPEDAGESIDYSYRGRHQITHPITAAHKLEAGGSGFEWKHAHQDYDLTDPATAESYRILKSIKDRPDTEATIYRAVPENVNDINPGDWVTLSRKYAQNETLRDPNTPKVISKRVRANEIGWDGNDINEFAYYPDLAEKYGKSTTKAGEAVTPPLETKPTGETVVKPMESIPPIGEQPIERVAPAEAVKVEETEPLSGIGNPEKAKKFRQLAEQMQAQIDELRRPLTQNPTPKRMAHYRERIIEADDLERAQQALRALADAHENRNVPPILADIKSKAEVIPLVRKGLAPGGGYYDRIASPQYKDTSPKGKALQALIEAKPEVKEAELEKQKAQKIGQLEADVQFRPLPGFFPTPKPIVRKMIAAADIKEGQSVLEPSAGKGDILDVLKEEHPNVTDVRAVEKLAPLTEILQAKGYNVAGRDFMDYKEAADRILMNPPFEHGQDIDHVRHAYDLLNPGGRLVAIMSEGSFSRSGKKDTAFREWLESVGGRSEKIEPGAFTGKDAFRQTGVATRMVVIDKPIPIPKLETQGASGEFSISTKKKVVDVPINQIHLRPQDFQGRQVPYIEEHVQNIVENFDINQFDPISLWKEPETGKLFTLNHNRFEAYKRLAEKNPAEFATIPAVIIEGKTFEEAKELARTSNVKNRPETYIERARYFREKRAEGVRESLLEKEAKRYDGKNSKTVLALSFLNPRGKAMSAIQALGEEVGQSARNAVTIAEWIGLERQQEPRFTNAHEDEMFEFLKKRYGNKIRQRSDFVDAVERAINRRKGFGEFDYTKPLDLENLSSQTFAERKLAEVKSALDEAKRIRDEKSLEFTARGATEEEKLRALKPYNDAVAAAEREYLALNERKAEILRRARQSEMSLFEEAKTTFFKKEDVDDIDLSVFEESNLYRSRQEGEVAHEFEDYIMYVDPKNYNRRVFEVKKHTEKLGDGEIEIPHHWYVYELGWPQFRGETRQEAESKERDYKDKVKQPIIGHLKATINPEPVGRLEAFQNALDRLHATFHNGITPAERIVPVVFNDYLYDIGFSRKYYESETSFHRRARLDPESATAYKRLKDAFDYYYGDKRRIARKLEAREFYDVSEAGVQAENGAEYQRHIVENPNITDVAERKENFERNKRLTEQLTLDFFSTEVAEPSGLYRADYRLQALGIAKDLKDYGATALIGKEVRSPQDLAAIAQVYRGKVEVSRYVFIKAGKVVGESAFTLNLPGGSNITPPGVEGQFVEAWIAEQLASHGADSFYLLHNHPSGIAEPSPQDVALTSRIAKYFLKSQFKGQVVIDSGEYSFIGSDGKIESRVKADFGPDELLKPSIPHTFLGMRIETSQQAANLAFMLNAPKGTLPAFGITAHGTIRTIATINERLLSDTKRLREVLYEIAKNSGSRAMVIAGLSTDRFYELMNDQEFKKVFDEGYLYDAVSTTGVSYPLSYDARFLKMQFGVDVSEGTTVAVEEAFPENQAVYDALYKLNGFYVEQGVYDLPSLAQLAALKVGGKLAEYPREFKRAVIDALNYLAVDATAIERMDDAKVFKEITTALKEIENGANEKEIVERSVRRAIGRGIYRESPDRPGQAVVGPTTGDGGRPSLRVIEQERVPTPKQYIGATQGLDEAQVFATNAVLTRFLDAKQKAYLLGDGAGVGKTRIELAVAKKMVDSLKKPALIVTYDEKVINGFRRQAEAMNLSIEASNIEIGTFTDLTRGRKAKAKGGGSFGVNKYSVVIFDEAQALKNATSARSIASGNTIAEHILFASATPMDKPFHAAYFLAQITGRSLDDVAHELGFVFNKQLDAFGREQFVPYLRPGFDLAKVLDNLIKLRNQAIADGAMLRREYPFWGEIRRELVEIPEDKLEEMQRIINYWQEHISIASERIRWAVKAVKEKFDTRQITWIQYQKELTQLRRAKNFKNNPIKKSLDEARARLRQELSFWTESQKMEEVIKRVKQALQEGKQPIVYAESVNTPIIEGLGQSPEDPKTIVYKGFLTELGERLQKEGIDFAKLYGGETDIVEADRFNRGILKVALATPQSGGVGINLDDTVGNAPRIVFQVTPNYAGDVTDQMLYRISRRNTASPSEFVFLYAPQSESDRARAKIIARKMAILRRIQGGADADIEAFQLEKDKPTAVGEPPPEYSRETRRENLAKREKELKTELGDWIAQRNHLLIEREYALTHNIEKSVKIADEELQRVNKKIGELRSELDKLVAGLYGGRQEVLFSKAEPLNATTLSNISERWYYSKLRRVAEEKMPGVATGDSVLAMLRNNGVKENEIKWTGIDDFLQGKEKVTKKELQEFLDKNEVRVKEVLRAEAGRSEIKQHYREQRAILKRYLIENKGFPEYSVDDYIARAANDELSEFQMRLLNDDPTQARLVEAVKEAWRKVKTLSPGGVKYAEYVLPGAEVGTYKELLLTLPQPSEGAFIAGHFEEPNVFAHIRFNERIEQSPKAAQFNRDYQRWVEAGKKGQAPNPRDYGKDQRVLFIEEIQSDWAQIGRQRGPQAVPPLPFAKNWHEIAFRRMLRWAAENGFDKVAWTTGEQQAERYDLSKQVSQIEYDTDMNILRADTPQQTRAIERIVAPKDLADYIGKEAAQKILEQPTRKEGRVHILSGLDLKVGGEGMKGFYDKILVDYANKLGKKWGAKVEVSYVPVYYTSAGERTIAPVHSLPITESMKKSVLEEGQPLFAKGQAEEGLSFEDTVKAIESIRENLGPNAPGIYAVQDTTDLPESVQKRLSGGIVEGVTWMYDEEDTENNIKIFLVSRNLRSKDDAVRVILHELVGHYGLRRTLGEKFDKTLSDVWRDFEAKIRSASWFEEYSGIEGYDPETDEGRVLLAEEYVAREFAEKNPNPNLIERIIAAIRRILRDLGIKIRLTSADIRAMVADSMRNLRNEVSLKKAAYEAFGVSTRKEVFPVVHEPLFSFRAHDEFSDAAKRIESFIKDAGNNFPDEGVQFAPSELRVWFDKVGRFSRAFIKALTIPYFIGDKYPGFGNEWEKGVIKKLGVWGIIDLHSREANEKVMNIIQNTLNEWKDAAALRVEQKAKLLDTLKLLNETAPIDREVSDVELENTYKLDEPTRRVWWQIRKALTEALEIFKDLDRYKIINKQFTPEIGELRRILSMKVDSGEFVKGKMQKVDIMKKYGFTDEEIEQINKVLWMPLTQLTEHHLNALWDIPLIRVITADVLVDEKYKSRILANYFPMSRPSDFKYAVVASSMEDLFGFQGGGARVPYFATFATSSEANAHALELQKLGYQPAPGESTIRAYYMDEDFLRRPLIKYLRESQLYDLVESAGVDPQHPVVRTLAKQLHVQGFDRHFVERQRIPGFQWTWENLERNVGEYIHQATRRYAKHVSIEEASKRLEELRGVAPDHVVKAAEDFFEAWQSANPRQWQTMRQIIYTTALGGSISNFLQNLTQRIITTWNEVPIQLKDAGVKTPFLTEEIMAEAAELQARYHAHQFGEKIGKSTSAGLPKEWIEIMDRLRKQGVVSPLQIEELAGIKREPRQKYPIGGPVKKRIKLSWRYYTDVMALGARVSEVSNRVSSAMTALILGDRYFHLKGDQLLEYVVNFIHSVDFNYAAYNRLYITQAFNSNWLSRWTANLLANMAYILEGFSFNYMGRLGRVARSRNLGAYTRTLIGIFALAGIRGLPFASLLGTLIGLVLAMKDDEDTPEMKERQILRPVERGLGLPERLLSTGLPAFAGVESSRLLGAGDLINAPTDITSVVGYPGTLIRKMGSSIEALKGGNMMKALEDSPMSPRILRDQMRAERIRREGVIAGGRVVLRPEDLTAGEIMLLRMGLTPISVQKAYEESKAQRAVGDVKREKYQQFLDRYVRAISSKDSEEMRHVIADIARFNKSAQLQDQINISTFVKSAYDRAFNIYRVRKEIPQRQQIGRVYE